MNVWYWALSFLVIQVYLLWWENAWTPFNPLTAKDVSSMSWVVKCFLYHLRHHQFKCHLIFLISRQKSLDSSVCSMVIFGERKKCRWKSAKKLYSGMQAMTTKAMTIWTLYVHIILNGVIFRQFHMILFHILSTCQFFPQVLL